LFRFDHALPRLVKRFDPVAGSATDDAGDEQTPRIIDCRFAFIALTLRRGDTDRNRNRRATLIRHAVLPTITKRLLAISMV